MKKIIALFLAALLVSSILSVFATAASTTDTLTRATTGVEDGSTSYANWSGKKAVSDATYAGNSAGSNNSIQMRSKNNSGIVTTTSGGYALSVEIVWNENTADGRTINVYGKDTAYESAADLYDSEKQGTLIGTIVKGTTTLSLGKGSKFIGIRSDNGALYLDSVKIVWSDTEGTEESSDPEPAENLTTPDEIVSAAYALENKAKLKKEYQLSGTITEIKFAYSATNKNLSVNMTVDGTTGENKDRVIYCFKMSDENGLTDVAHVGDSITVKGTLMNYNGTIEFSPCTLISFTSNYVAPATYPETPEAIVNAAYGLASGETLEAPADQKGKYTLTGVISEIDSKGNKYIVVGEMTDKKIQLYKLTGEGSDLVDVGDTVTVTGQLKNYNGTIEFNGCTLDSYTLIEREPETLPETTEEIMEALYALESGKFLKGEYTLTGKITEINTKYNSQYENITVTIKVDGFKDKPVMCYRLAGKGCDKLAVGDVITVTGKLKNSDGTREFDQGCSLVAYSPATGDEIVAAVVVSVVATLGAAILVSKKKRV
ncbi:MAG: hypothetical protein J5830_04615 [Clostridia bacterium]|nr:hypothetical protein [Clostridia bacterium]